LEKLPI